MWLDEVVDEGELLSQRQRLDFTTELPKPGAFTGAIDVLGPGLARGGLEASSVIESGFSSLWQTGLNAAAGALLPEPKFGGTPNVTSAEESSQETLGQGTAQAVMELRPDPAEVGVVGQILGEAAAILPRTVAGTIVAGPIGGAVAAGAPAGYSSKQVGMAEGLDESTATLKGVLDATTVGIGAIMPAARFVGPVLGDAAIAVGANVGLGAAGRGLTAQLLEGGGYTAQAAQYRAMDGTAMATDAILGAAFFGIGRAGMRRPTTQQVDAALTERTAQHFDVDTAPGAPINPRSAVAHQEALKAAIDQLQRGEPVVLPESIHAADFLRSVDDAPPIAPSRDQALVSAREDLSPKLRVELEQEAAGILPNVKDIRAELGTVTKSLAALDDSFRERAKAFQAEGQSRKRAEASARQAIEAERLDLTDRQAALNDHLVENRTAELARADLAALDRGEMPKRFDGRLGLRADAITKGFEKTPLAAGVADAGRAVSTRQTAEQVARSEVDRLVYEHELTLPREAAAAPAARPTVANSGETVSAQPGRSASQPAASGKLEPSGQQPKAGKSAEPAELELLRSAITRKPDAMIRTGFDEDGKPTSRRADEVLADIEAEHAKGVREAGAFNAAIGCLLRL